MNLKTSLKTAKLGTILLSLVSINAFSQETDTFNDPAFVGRGIMMFADTSRGRPYAKDPAVVRFQGAYFMYYSVGPGNGVEGWRIGVATSTNLISWLKVGELAIAGDYEKKGFCAPGARVLKGKIHLFYQTYGNGSKDAICHAWSSDGITFTRNPENPVFAPKGAWTNGRAIDADVIEHKGRLILGFATRDPSGKVQLQGIATAAIDSDFGKAAWTQQADHPTLKPELPWEKDCIEAAAFCKHNGTLFMFYGGAYNNYPQQIGCATSTDGLIWTRAFTTPFLANGKPGDWNASESGHPFAFTDDDGRTYLFYQGNKDKGKSWYLSHVEIGWKDNTPVILGSSGRR